MRIVYSRHYDIGFFGLERWHPFDSRKYSHAWRCLRRNFGRRLNRLLVTPRRPVTRDELLRVHGARYLDSLRDPATVAAALELPPVARLPAFVIDYCVLRPMRWGVAGSVIAAQQAMKCGLAVNLSGGYHHAKPNGGEGFCVYNDIAFAVAMLRDEGTLAVDSRVAYIDLDAHLGNGVGHMFMDDSSVFMFDMYNKTIYPYDPDAEDRVDCKIGAHAGWSSDEYIHTLTDKLPTFLQAIHDGETPVEFAIYNAGTDVFEGDSLGNLNVTAAHVLERDLFVIEQLLSRNIPTVMLLSGGYSRESHRLVFETVRGLVDRYSGRRTT